MIGVDQKGGSVECCIQSCTNIQELGGVRWLRSESSRVGAENVFRRRLAEGPYIAERELGAVVRCMACDGSPCCLSIDYKRRGNVLSPYLVDVVVPVG